MLRGAGGGNGAGGGGGGRVVLSGLPGDGGVEVIGAEDAMGGGGETGGEFDGGHGVWCRLNGGRRETEDEVREYKSRWPRG